MKRAGIARLKAQLSRYVEQVKAGEEVVITERGRPVAKLVPLAAAQRDPRLERLARAGLVQFGRGRVRASLLRPARGPRRLGAGVLKALLAERDEGR